MNAINIIQKSGKRGNSANDIGLSIISNRAEEQDPPSGSGTSSGNLKTIVRVTATETIAKYDVVTTDGKVADSTNVLHKDKILGIAIEDIAIGVVGEVQISGELTEVTWAWTAYSLFLNGTALSETVPTSGFLNYVALIKAPQIIVVNIEESILL